MASSALHRLQTHQQDTPTAFSSLQASSKLCVSLAVFTICVL